MNSAPSDHPLRDAYNPEHMQPLLDNIQHRLQNHLARMAAREEKPVMPVHSPDALYEAWNHPVPAEGLGEDAALELLQQAIEQSIHVHHPRYIGHQVSAPLPLASACDWVSSSLNNGAPVYEMGAVETVMERRLTEWIATLAGYQPDEAGGVFTSGGSLGNLTALLAARQIMGARKGLGNIWQDGYAPDTPRPAVLVSEQAHYCVKRAVQIMGLGAESAIAIETDSQYRMDIRAMKQAYYRAQDEGRQVIAIVASGCTTATGTYDPIRAIADFCDAQDLWLHIDGAHGFAARLSPRYQGWLDGAERANSIVWDMHKMMCMPTLSTAIVFREKAHAYAALAEQASYLYDASAEEEWFNLGHRTVECTKGMVALKTYISLMAYGTERFGAHVTRCYDMTQQFYAMLKEAGDFTVATQPDANIICFRYLPKTLKSEAASEFQRRIREALLKQGRFYIVQTVLRGERYLRCTIINPLTEMSDLHELLQEIRSIGTHLLSGDSSLQAPATPPANVSGTGTVTQEDDWLPIK